MPFADAKTLYLLRNYGLLLAACAVGSTPLPGRIYKKVREWFENEGRQIFWQLLWSAAGTILFLLCTAYLVDATYNPFLYFRF